MVSLIDLILGPKCLDCSSRIKGERFPAQNRQWVCVTCKTKRDEAQKRREEEERRKKVEQKQQAEEQRKRREEEDRKRRQAKHEQLEIAQRWIQPIQDDLQSQRHNIQQWIHTLPRSSELDDGWISNASRPLPEPLETLAIELREENEPRTQVIAETVNELFGMAGMKAIFFRACRGDRGLYYRLTGRFDGIGDWRA